MQFRYTYFIVLVLTTYIGCQTIKLPTTTYKQYNYQQKLTYNNDTLKIYIQNPLHCPLRVWISTSNSHLQNKLTQLCPVVLQPQSSTTLTFANITNFKETLNFSSLLGDTSQKIQPTQVDFPFLKNKRYTILQANNSNYTHNTNWSRYALDFNLPINDTICAATNGYVVGVVDKYKLGGLNQKWKPLANYLTIYDPVSGIFSQYVHLVQNGSLVKVGDKVQQGQIIALSGNTGFSTTPHLHFSCLVPVNNNDGLESIPIIFKGGLNGTELKKGDTAAK